MLRLYSNNRKHIKGSLVIEALLSTALILITTAMMSTVFLKGKEVSLRVGGEASSRASAEIINSRLRAFSAAGIGGYQDWTGGIIIIGGTVATTTGSTTIGAVSALVQMQTLVWGSQYRATTTLTFSDPSFAGRISTTTLVSETSNWRANYGGWNNFGAGTTVNVAGNTNGNRVAWYRPSATPERLYFLLGTTANAGGPELFMYEVTGTSTLTLRDSLEINTAVLDITLVGTRAYIATALNTQELKVISIADPTNISLAADVDLFGTENLQALTYDGTRLWGGRATGLNGDLVVFDLTNPDAPVILATSTVGAGINALHADFGGVGAAIGSNTNELQTFTYSGGVITLQGLYDATGNGAGNAVTSFGSYFVLGRATNGIDIISAPSISSLTNASTIAVPAAVNGLFVGLGETELFAATSDVAGQLKAVSIVNPLSPVIEDSELLLGNANDVAWDRSTNNSIVAVNSANGEIALVSASTPSSGGGPVSPGGFALIHMLDPGASIVRSARWYRPTAAPGTRYAIIGTAANAGGPEFLIYNYASTTNPILAGSREVGADVNSVYVMNDTAFIGTASTTAEVSLINVASTTNPTLISAVNMPNTTSVLGVYATGTRMWAGRTTTGGPAASNQDIYAYDITTPSAPVEFAKLNIGGAVRAVEGFVGNVNRIYAGQSLNTQEVAVYNAASGVMTLIGSYNGGGAGGATSIVRNGAQMGLGYGGGTFEMLSLASTTAPASIGTLTAGGSVNGIAFMDYNADTFAVLGTAAAGLEVSAINLSVLPYSISHSFNATGTVNSIDVDASTKQYLIGGANTAGEVLVLQYTP